MSKKPLIIVTHNGAFHADDVFACAALLLVYPEAIIIRSRDKEDIQKGDIVVDVGEEYDPKRMRFDHHQIDGASVRQNGIPYASFGLVWKEYGFKIAGSEEVAQVIEEKLAYPIDAQDNGFAISSAIIGGVKEYSIADYLDSFTYDAQTMKDFDEVFKTVLPIAQKVIKHEIEIAKVKIAEWEETRRLYEESLDKEIIVLPRIISWKHVLIPTRAQFVVSPRTDGRWQVRCVPKAINSFESKKPLPEEWAGKRDNELENATGVGDAIFCHKGRFLAVAGGKEGAIALAKLALAE